MLKDKYKFFMAIRICCFTLYKNININSNTFQRSVATENPGPYIKWCWCCSHLRSSYGWYVGIIGVEKFEHVIAPSGTMFVPSFMKIHKFVQKLLVGGTCRHNPLHGAESVLRR